ncbi:MBL fold metallo-hydrolase RNA specificity domain-containing protein [Sneathiella chinensis]|uniref:MBL fold hydrolase n=1 Tax=Sneathiella chinensis TaxID=349750 RepID=A0ABQ5TYY4_9PROT|nr:MBL fold metallo-hydrolase [Sneathiella chinensis]GLQ04799.1 MBL fold hydrolase [Sneathiella chinensis]
MKITFLGATGTVTGSKYLLEDYTSRILVDCGLFQGLKELRLRNWNPLPIDPASIDKVLLTHAHLDHSGYIPRFVKAGFKGPIHCSDGTLDLCRILLPDSGRIQEEDAARVNRYGYTRHHPALPLYTEKEANRALKQFQPVEFGSAYALNRDLSFSLHRAGHILGASFVRLESSGGTSVLFSGDIGRPNDPVMKEPAKMQDADYLVLESTYGNRKHDSIDPAKEIGDIVRTTIERGGTVVIPSFAVGRAQLILFYIHQLKATGQLPGNLPVFLDSPMAINASELLCRHLSDHRMSRSLCHDVCNVARFTRTVDESKDIFNSYHRMPKIIISASGMATGGRVLHHLKTYLGDRRSTILLVGFQAAGTRGDRLARGEKEIKIHGDMWPVNADVHLLDSMSAHADYTEILGWLENFREPPRKVFIVHGEPEAALGMQSHIQEKFGWETVIPEYLQEEEL